MTAVSHDGQYIPLAAGANYSDAQQVARSHSMNEAWREVQVKVSDTREIVATFANGEDLDARSWAD